MLSISEDSTDFRSSQTTVCHWVGAKRVPIVRTIGQKSTRVSVIDSFLNTNLTNVKLQLVKVSNSWMLPLIRPVEPRPQTHMTRIAWLDRRRLKRHNSERTRLLKTKSFKFPIWSHSSRTTVDRTAKQLSAFIGHWCEETSSTTIKHRLHFQEHCKV